MKTTRIVKNILFAGTLSLTLASCGGGGGGGGGEAPSTDNNSATNTPTNQQGYAPYNLAGCTINYVREGHPFTFEFDNSGQVNGKVQMVDSIILYKGTYTYSRSADGMGATLVLKTTSGKTSDGIAKEQTFEMKLKFSSNTKAIAEVDYEIGNYVGGSGFAYHDDHYTASVTFSGAGVLDNGSSEGESNNDSSTDSNTQLAPDTLPAGKVVNLHSGTGTVSSYTLNSTTSCTSNTGAKLTWEYSVTGDTTAEWVTSNALNIPITTKMVFTSATGGTYTRLDSGNKVIASGTFNLSDKADAPSHNEDISDSNDNEEGEQSEIVTSSAPESIVLTSCLMDGTFSKWGLVFLTETQVAVTSAVNWPTSGAIRLQESIGNYSYKKISPTEGELVLAANGVYYNGNKKGSEYRDFVEIGMVKHTFTLQFDKETGNVKTLKHTSNKPDESFGFYDWDWNK